MLYHSKDHKLLLTQNVTLGSDAKAPNQQLRPHKTDKPFNKTEDNNVGDGNTIYLYEIVS